MAKNNSDLSGWNNLLSKINKLKSVTIETGFFEEDTYDADNDFLPVAQVAAWQEFGTPTIPPRAFIRLGWTDAMHSRAFTKVYGGVVKRIIAKKQSVGDGLEQLGFLSQSLMKREIREWDYPPNAPSTVSHKGFNDPLIETEKMLDSVKFKLT